MTNSDCPWEPPLAGTEVEHLVGALERLRTTFRWKAGDLDSAGLQTRDVLFLDEAREHRLLILTVKLRASGAIDQRRDARSIWCTAVAPAPEGTSAMDPSSFKSRRPEPGSADKARSEDAKRIAEERESLFRYYAARRQADLELTKKVRAEVEEEYRREHTVRGRIRKAFQPKPERNVIYDPAENWDNK